MTTVFPNNNLPTSSQPWAREVQKQLNNLITSSAADEINNAARDNQLNSSIIALSGVVSDVTSALTEIGILETTVLDPSDPTKINGANLKVGSVTSDSIAANAITSAKIAANTITASDIASGTITATQIASNTITATQINSGYVYAGNISADQINTGTLSANYINGGAITASSLQLTSSAFEIRVGTTSQRAYMACSIDAPNGLGFNEIGFAAAAGDNRSGWISNCFPRYANSNSLGVDGKRWNEIFCTNATINTSDARLKTDIKDSELGLDFINALRPVSYKWISGGSDIVKDENGNIIRDENDEATLVNRPGVRPHWGFIAQEVKEVIDSSGVEDFAGFVQEDINDPESLLSLRYGEFIAPMVKAIQELSARVETLENGA